MKYRLYLSEFNSIGFVYDDETNLMVGDFFWPSPNEPFKTCGLHWITLDVSVELYGTYIKAAKFIKSFDSVEEIKQWIYENYFEWFL